MTTEEWGKFCEEHNFVAIDVNYKDMTYEDALNYLDLINIAFNASNFKKDTPPLSFDYPKKLNTARKYDLQTGKHEEYVLPEGATNYEDDMQKRVSCAECGKKILYGMSYTSRIIQSYNGIGYAVCRDCYFKNDLKDLR